ncbi:MAG: DUF4184 family protein [Micromonosporaceae bacterium]|jgi:hypothetical protein
MTFPTHPAAVVAMKLWRPRRFDGVALVLGAMAPDLAYVVDGSGLPVWPFSHQPLGMIGWSLPLVVAGTRVVRWAAPVVAAHLPPGGPLALRDYGAVRAARHRWWITAYCALLGAGSHLVLDPVETRVAALDAVLDVAGAAVMLAIMVHVGRRRLIRAWYGDPPALRRRPVLFWGVAGAVALPAMAATPFLPAAHLPHTTGVRVLCAVAGGLLAAALAVSLRNGRSRPCPGAGMNSLEPTSQTA